MKKVRILASLVIVAVLIVSIYGCRSKDTTTPTVQVPTDPAPKVEKYYDWYYLKEVKPGVDQNVDDAVVVAKEWFYARCVKGDMGAEWELLSDTARCKSKEEYIEKTTQESDDIGHAVRKERDGEITKISAKEPDHYDKDKLRAVISFITPDGTWSYGFVLLKDESGKEWNGWKVSQYGGGPNSKINE